jgi:hypothetical protein
MLLSTRPVDDPIFVPVNDPTGTKFIEAPAPPMPASAGAAWFSSVKPYCNPLEVEVHLRQSPPPGGVDGAGFAAACWAVAGKIDRAKATIDALPAEDRQHAASIVFGIGHPIADMGDDLSAGPIMELVVEYQPQNYMALYHAGMSYHALGRKELARRHLIEFLRLYNVNDGWKTNAENVLRQLSEKQ